MIDHCQNDAIDVSFSVPLVHRLRFTHEVFGTDRQILADLLESSGSQRVRVQFWIDSGVAEANPALSGKIRQFCGQFSDRIVLAGPPQVVPGGEAAKNDVHLIERMLKEIHAACLDRRSYVVAIGGGAVLDAVGFAAAISHRGIRLVRLPTTTLAQADSGIGVKNGVNLFRTKNWLGTFTAPWAVINDAALLTTLSDRDFLAGMAEVVKVALLGEPALLERLWQAAPQIRRRDMPVCLPLLRRSAELHLHHITRGGDPFEMLEARPLDLGHWSAHKLEAMSNFSLRHGEAVAIGLAIDAVYSSLALGLPPGEAARVLVCLDRLGFRLDHPQLADIDQLLDGLEEFRQHLGGQLTLTLLKEIGRPVDVCQVDRKLLRRAVVQVRELAGSSEKAMERSFRREQDPRGVTRPHRTRGS